MKQKIMYVCDQCGYETAKWMGKCPSCNAWDTLGEFHVKNEVPGRSQGMGNKKPIPLHAVETDEESRFFTGIGEFDRVLGGGAVKGSFILVGGEPGIGKSTLLLQMCAKLQKQARVLYISGEESIKQIKLRADRLSAEADELLVFSETDLLEMIRYTDELKPDILIVDSIQTVYHPQISSAPGNATQIKECAMELMRYAKRSNVTIFIVGHVNKDGAIAGPKMLEHMVDCVLYFEGEKHMAYRMLRAAKNRYGSTNEIGVFEMTGRGLCEVLNPSAALLSGHLNDEAGNCIVATMEGSRPILVEIQALATKSAFGMPRRTAAGVDFNRMVLLLAILEKRMGMYLSGLDVYVNVIGGIRLDEPAVDLPILLAIASSFREKPLKPSLIAFGEVGLTGEIRSVSMLEQRIAEAKRMGFHICLIPEQDRTFDVEKDGIQIIQVRNVTQALAVAF